MRFLTKRMFSFEAAFNFHHMSQNATPATCLHGVTLEAALTRHDAAIPKSMLEVKMTVEVSKTSMVEYLGMIQ